MHTDDTRPADRSALRALLQARRRDVTDDLQLRMARIRDRGSAPVPLNEQEEADAADLDVALVDIASGTLRAIDQAIERVDDGTYGVCALCGGAIAEARLTALPFAVRCQRCEAAREHASGDRTAAARRRGWPGDHPGGGRPA